MYIPLKNPRTPKNPKPLTRIELRAPSLSPLHIHIGVRRRGFLPQWVGTLRSEFPKGELFKIFASRMVVLIIKIMLIVNSIEHAV